MQESDGKMVQTGRYSTYLHDHGEGSAVLLIHGSGPGVSAWANWSRVLPVLAAHFRVIAPDLLGFGKSEKPTGSSYGLDRWVDHLQAVLKSLGVERVHLIGNSLGGALALSLATRMPQQVGKMVLMGSVGVPFPITEGLARVWGYRARSRDEMEQVMRSFVWDGQVSDELVTMRYEASLDPVMQDAYASMFPAPLQQHIDALVTPEAAVRRIEAPTLLLHGRDDQVIPPETSLRLGQLLPQGDVHLFARCGHWIQIERSQDFNALARQFLLD